jgi:hypothetical protein
VFNSFWGVLDVFDARLLRVKRGEIGVILNQLQKHPKDVLLQMYYYKHYGMYSCCFNLANMSDSSSRRIK